jgi:hypothetical protein
MKILTFPDKLLELGSIFFPACVTYSEENSHRSLTLRRDGRVAEGARLESVFTRKGNVGSNPTLSAIFFNNLQALQSVCNHLLYFQHFAGPSLVGH